MSGTSCKEQRQESLCTKEACSEESTEIICVLSLKYLAVLDDDEPVARCATEAGSVSIKGAQRRGPEVAKVWDFGDGTLRCGYNSSPVESCQRILGAVVLLLAGRDCLPSYFRRRRGLNFLLTPTGRRAHWVDEITLRS